MSTIRFYICPMIERLPDAEEAAHGITVIREPAVEEYPVIRTELIHHRGKFCLVRVDADDHSQIIADVRMLPIPNSPGSTILTARQRTALENRLAGYGVDVVVPDGTTIRQALTAIGKRIAPTFNVDGFARGTNL